MAKDQNQEEKCNCCGGEFRLSNFGLEHQKPELFVTSQWGQRIHPIIYVIWRVFWSIFFFVWIVLSGVHVDRTSSREENHIKWFIYLTNWAFFLLNIDLLVHAIVTVVEYIKQRKVGGYESMYTEMPWSFKMVWVLHNVNIGFSVVTSAGYWGLIYGDEEELDDINFMTHGMNSIYIILDLLFVTGVPVRLYHLIHPLIAGVVYLVFTVIYDVAGGTNALDKDYIYSVIDWSKDPGTSTLYAVLVAFVGMPVVWLIFYGLYQLRLLMTEKCCQSRNSSNNVVV